MPKAESSVVPKSAAKPGVVDEADSAGAVRDDPSVGSSPLVISNSLNTLDNLLTLLLPDSLM